jgi:hypothetical protein
MLRPQLSLLAALFFAAPASAQLTTIGPFTGMYHEEFEATLSYPWPQCLPNRIFSNHGDACTPLGGYCVEVQGWLLYCAIYAHNGSNGLFGSAQGPVEFTLDVPALRIGGYFGTNGYLPGGWVDFYDASNNLLGTRNITAPACAWAWNGWDAGTGPGIKRFVVYANDPYNQGALMQMDDFQMDPAVPSMGSLCDPGTGGVLACPCSNPPAGAERGCNNSSGTGGAHLTAFGHPWIVGDTLVFTSSGERPTATSILLQGENNIAAGAAFGQGVRCLTGNLKRLYVKTAVAGSITAPGPGDPGVYARATMLGDVIANGDTRYYGVYYRDPIVLGACSAANTFNITQTGSVQWQ